MSSTATAALEVATAEVSSGRPPAAPPARAIRTVSWSDQHRVVDVAGGGKGYLAMSEGYNDGWRATAYGRTLTPVRMDGWQQGWKLPPGGATRVTLTFGPGRMQHGVLLGGLAAGAARARARAGAGAPAGPAAARPAAAGARPVVAGRPGGRRRRRC